MSQLALTFAQRAATSVAQGFAARAISSLLAKRRDTGARLEELNVLSSTDGATMPITFGRVRLGGQVIWADQPIEHAINRRAGGKGGPRVTDRSYTLSIAIGLCEGEIDGIGRIWADGALFKGSATNIRVYEGTRTQLPDPLIEIRESSARTPAFRGLAYVVFEDLGLEEFGNRIPQFSFEVFRTPKGFGSENVEDKIKGVALIPGSGEFVYATEPVITDLGPGRSYAENVHSFKETADVEVSLDTLQTQAPNCKAISLVVSWFGDDLRCANLKLQPRVENNTKTTTPQDWQVEGLDRTQVPLVSLDALLRPNFGGTPSDLSVLQTIASLKLRGFETVFHPFVMMDIPAGNALPDPYGANEQAAFPWRGRITAFPASGQAGTVDKTSNAAPQIDLFFGTASASDFTMSGQNVVYSGPNEWSYRRFILHYAMLCAIAGGVDAFLIGSELRGMTMLRDEANGFPAIARLRQLAAEVRLILPSAKISYAADWSEYFGYHPQDNSSDVYFNLDPLWADPNIDFVGIDWYVPLADWREGNQHLDAASYRSIYDKAYLSANIEGGEGYDWFYASFNDRQNQLRSTIIDGVYAKDWVFRYKDLRSWWASQHYDRPGGIERPDATAWIPESKPIWFTETGCPAIDKGANQPNVFVDPKSSESTFPYFSRGRRDDFIQRMYIDAITSYWTASNNKNPVSSIYGEPMVDESKILIWTWDARPFPQFPALEDVWSDGVNWEKGHWLNGRLGLSSLAILIQDICARAGITTLDVSQVEGLVTGYVVTGPTNARAALESILEVYGVEILEVFDGLRFQHVGQEKEVLTTTLDDFVQEGGERAPALVVPDNESLPLEVRVQFTDEGADYQPASANARDIAVEKRKTIDLALPLVSDREFIRNSAGDVLARAKAAMFSASITLPPSFLALEPGDAIRVPALDLNKVWRVTAVDDALQRELTLVADSPATVFVRAGAKPGLTPPPSSNPGPPVLAVMDLPLLAGETGRNGPKIATFAEPWTQDILFLDALTQTERSSANTPAIMGEVINTLPAGGISGRWDYATQISIKTYGGVLSSATQQAVLGGQNMLAIEHDGGQWEVLQFQSATLTGENSYTLFGLLRGQSGSDDAFTSPVSPKARWVMLNGASNTLPMQDFEIGVPIAFLARPVSAQPGSLEELSFSVTYTDRVSRMPAPVHIGVNVNAADVELFWTRRARKGGDYWGIGDIPLDATPEAYRVRLYAASAVLDERIVSFPEVLFGNAELDSLFPLGRPPTLDVGITQCSPLGGAGIEARKIVYI